MSGVFHSVPTTAPGVPFVPKPPSPSFHAASSKSGFSQPSAGFVGRVAPRLRGLLARSATSSRYSGGGPNSALCHFAVSADVELDHLAVVGHRPLTSISTSVVCV